MSEKMQTQSQEAIMKKVIHLRAYNQAANLRAHIMRLDSDASGKDGSGPEKL